MAYNEKHLVKLADLKEMGNKQKEVADALAARVDTLENVGSQANVLEGVKVNGTALSIANKMVDILIATGELVKLCEQELQWKKSTTYTVLKKLCEHGIFQNENGTVTSLLSQEGYNAVQSEKFVEDTFDGSLPAFLAAFTTRKSLSEKDIAEIQRMIDRCGKE